VYVLGALSRAERYRFERHLASCAACRDELVGLAGLPGLLRRLTVAEAGGSAADRPPP
jgi:anti-sigma factor RsiW